MAKFFKEDLDKSNKTKEHEPGSLIKDLGNLGKNKEDEFLKGFPKTPAEIEAEEVAKKKKEEAIKRATEEAERVQAEADKIAVIEAEQEAFYKAEAMKKETIQQSLQVKNTVVKTKTDHVNGFVATCIMAVNRLNFCFMAEFKNLGCSIAFFCNKTTELIRRRVNRYYKQNPEKKLIRHQKNRKMMRQFIQTKNNFIAKEKAAATKMVRFINHMDNKNEQIADKTTVIVTEGNKKFNFAREWAEINKRKLLMHFGVIIFVAICAVAVFNYSTAYEYAYNGRTLGLVDKQEDVLKIVDIVSEQLSKEHNAEISIDKERDITFKRVNSISKDVDDTEQVLKRLTYMRNMNAKAYGIYVNNARVAIVDSKKTAKTIFDSLKATYVPDDGINYESIGFKENIDVKQIETKLGRIQNIDAATQKLLTGAVYQQVHTVAAGDTLSGIAKMYATSISDLKSANPTLNPEKLSIGQQIILTKPAPMVTIKTVEVTTYPEPIFFETEYKDTKSLYKGDTKTEIAGINGERSVTARITKENGVQVESVELASRIVSNPVTAVITRGTKEKPATVGTGNLKYPVSGFRLTSKFGSRWGRMHYGLDLACPTGTRIGASDGGTVIYSGYSGSYGYVVKINHGSGMVTIYAHCSKLLVRKGDKVYQGQHIANVGSTGRSTGPHCHFEVQVNGVPKNPMIFL